MNIFKIMIVSLISTLIIEIIGAIILGIRDKKDLVNVLLVNVLTNPLVVSIAFLINLRYGIVTKRIVMIFLELFAFLVEGFIYKKVLKFKKINGYIISLILNLISYSIGIIINIIIW